MGQKAIEQQLSVVFPNFYHNTDGDKPLLEFFYSYLNFFLIIFSCVNPIGQLQTKNETERTL